MSPVTSLINDLIDTEVKSLANKLESVVQFAHDDRGIIDAPTGNLTVFALDHFPYLQHRLRDTLLGTNGEYAAELLGDLGFQFTTAYSEPRVYLTSGQYIQLSNRVKAHT